MSDLVAWVRAQLDATEAAAKAVKPSPDLHPADPIEFILSNNDLSTPDIEAAERHIALHDPAAVLADVASKREMLDYAERIFANAREHPGDLASKGAFLAMRVIVRNLAEGFRHRPGYEEAMRDA